MEPSWQARVETIEGARRMGAVMDNGKFDQADLLSAVNACVNIAYEGSLLSTSKAIGKFRMLSGDFVTPDEELAIAISRTAIALGYVVMFDERPGADSAP
jgi:hypothetical protein